jgi:hypothetical protein
MGSQASRNATLFWRSSPCPEPKWLSTQQQTVESPRPCILRNQSYSTAPCFGTELVPIACSGNGLGQPTPPPAPYRCSHKKQIRSSGRSRTRQAAHCELSNREGGHHKFPGTPQYDLNLRGQTHRRGAKQSTRQLIGPCCSRFECTVPEETLGSPRQPRHIVLSIGPQALRASPMHIRGPAATDAQGAA